VELPEVQGSCDQYCQCDAEAMKGRVFRLTRLEIDEPDAFAEILNLLWDGDVKNNILNVLIHVDDAVAGKTSAFNSIKITAGPAWRIPKMPYILRAEEGKPMADPVTSYCLLKGLSFEMELLPYHGYQCEVKSAGPASLYFHSGPRDAPLICAPFITPPNNIPISDLSIRTGFNRDCTGITDGYLEGCITVDSADRICMCPGQPGTCGRSPVEGYVFDPQDLTGYCHNECGPDWISFGELVKSFGLLPSCITEGGIDGYRVQGFFDAVPVTEKHNPISTDDCQQTEGTP
jgi:hypothetical protein